MAPDDPRRSVPRTDALLADPRLIDALDRLGPAIVKAHILQAQQRIREGQLAPDQAIDAVLATIPQLATSLRPVLNATGIVLHTNLGRAALSSAAVEAIDAAAGYVDVEFDLASGARSRRGRGTLDALRQAVPAADDALVLNNGAAALLLATTHLARDRELLVSRGEFVEIGDGFRLPDLIAAGGVTIREVGTTNRTTVADYADAIGPNTAAILKVHPSNFVVSGFTAAVDVTELAQLGRPVIVDVGSGLLQPHPLLPDEPDVTSALRAGASLVTASGDKLLGGPQAGLVFGDADLVQALRRHPMTRALRVDKLTLAALEATLRGPAGPTWQYLTADPGELRRRCDRIANALVGTVETEVVTSSGAVGGGGAPGLALTGWAVALDPSFAEPLRREQPAIVGRIWHDWCLLDPRCVPPADDDVLIDAVRRIAQNRGIADR